MSEIVWDPAEKRPADAVGLEAEIRAVAPDAQVKLTWRDAGWVVRALRPAAMCGRGGTAADRDVSGPVAAVLSEAGHPARA